MYENLKALLKNSGYSLTKSRRTVFDLLAGQEPQSMQVLIQRAAGKTDRATIYRTIELFERLGIVQRLNIGWKYKIELSDVFNEHHHHLYCTNCGTTLTLPAHSMLESMIETLARKEGFAIRGHQLEIYGLCPNCQPGR